MEEINKKLKEYFKGDELAQSVWKSKYAMDGETHYDQMHKRMAKEFARIEENYYDKGEQWKNKGNLSDYGSVRSHLQEEDIYNLFKDFKYIVPQGSIMATLGTKTIASLSNCWVEESPLDSYGGILKADANLAYYYKRRGGVGMDLSNLRPKGTNTNNTAKSTTGAVSFMHRFSNTTREVAMEGRRGALMLSMSINHPDIMDFIKVKRDGTSVTGANISIKLNDEFMKAVENDEDYVLRFPCDADISYFSDEYIKANYNELHYIEDHKNNNAIIYTKTIKAKEYWDEIVKSAKNHAEPGLMYWDNVINYDPAAVYEQFKPTCSNPCVIGDTTILTRDGYKTIKSQVGKELDVWNGFEWTNVKPKVTGRNQKVVKVTLSDGKDLTVTEYHKWILKGGFRVQTLDLKVGAKLLKYHLPIIKGGEEINDKVSYTQRFVTVKSIESAGIEDEVFCFHDKKNNSGLFNGVMTANCGEQFLNPNDSCRLMALNLFSFVDNPFTDKAEINYKKLYEISYEHCSLGDDLIDLELEYIQRIIDKIKSDPEPDDVKKPELDLWIKSYNNTKAGRRIGLGITALADMLAGLNLGYDSKEGLEIIDKVMSIKMEAELDCTIDLSILRGSFEGYDSNLEFVGVNIGVGCNDFYQMLLDIFPKQCRNMSAFGRRNVSWSTIAPTGSVSLMTQTSSGCEPLFMPFYMRRKKINPNEEGIIIDFVDEIGDSWQEFSVLHPKFELYLSMKIKGWNKVDFDSSKEFLQLNFEHSPWYGSTANDIDWVKRNKIQSILQKYTTNAISSTINLPSTVTEQEVSDIYMSGWKMGLKGQTVYVEGSRSGVLVSNDKKDNNKFEYRDAIKRPKSITGESHTTIVKGDKYAVIIGLLDNKPYEVFAFKGEIPNLKSEIVKKKRGHYSFSDIDITDNLTDEQEAITRGYSWGLRNGGDVKYAVEQLQKTKGNLTDFTKALARILKKYIPDGATSTLTCEDCGSKEIIFEEGCSKCRSCGSSKCG